MQTALLSPEGERLFSALMNRNHRLLDAAINLRDYVTQMREAYQAQIDIEQNSLMKVFTASLATPRRSPSSPAGTAVNFARMPELEWAWSYPAVALISGGRGAGPGRAVPGKRCCDASMHGYTFLAENSVNYRRKACIFGLADV